jgi:actin related protein 2/3 complex subunit 1A/1B
VLGIGEGHDSTIHFVTDVGPTPRARSLSLRHLPLRDVGQLSPTSILH